MIGQMNVEVSLSRTGRGLETDEFTETGGERGVERGRNAEIIVCFCLSTIY